MLRLTAVAVITFVGGAAIFTLALAVSLLSTAMSFVTP
jgi:hypothetical protein